MTITTISVMEPPPTQMVGYLVTIAAFSGYSALKDRYAPGTMGVVALGFGQTAPRGAKKNPAIMRDV